MFSTQRELGVGVAYSPALAGVLDLNAVDVLEVEPRMFWRPEGGRHGGLDVDALARLAALPQRKVVHTRALPVGGSLPFDRASLALLQSSTASLGASYVSQHLGFDRVEIDGEERFTGMLLPPRHTESGVRRAASSLKELRTELGLEVAFETGVSYLRRAAGEIPDGEFFARIANEADCGILLDLHDLVTNERNGGDRAYEVVAALPRERVWEIHLAGGYAYGGFWIDARSGTIDPYAFELAEATVGDFPNLRAIVFEIAPEFVESLAPEAATEQIRLLRTLWSRRARRRTVSSCAPHVTANDAAESELSGWESALGSIALGRVPAGEYAGLAADPAAALLSDLVDGAREATLFERAPLTMRLLSAALGAAAFRSLLFSYLRARSPEPFAELEARHFLDFSETEAAIVPYLDHVIALERASLAAADGALQEVRFNCDPAQLLAALAARRPPRALKEGDYVVRLRGTQIEILDGGDSGAIVRPAKRSA
jgi:uncharacterized protein (UPF0276 family)